MYFTETHQVWHDRRREHAGQAWHAPGRLPFFFILQCIVSFFARPDPYDVLDIVNEYLAVARMSSVQGFRHRGDASLDGDPAHDDVGLDLGKEPRFHRSAAEVFR